MSLPAAAWKLNHVLHGHTHTAAGNGAQKVPLALRGAARSAACAVLCTPRWYCTRRLSPCACPAPSSTARCAPVAHASSGARYVDDRHELNWIRHPSCFRVHQQALGAVLRQRRLGPFHEWPFDGLFVLPALAAMSYSSASTLVCRSTFVSGSPTTQSHTGTANWARCDQRCDQRCACRTDRHTPCTLPARCCAAFHAGAERSGAASGLRCTS
jgi:hypothetical protein